jgi:phage shock protein PspC (stress-responsive transcriptional regulator)
MTATAAQTSLFTRNDTIFGACEGIGEDFGFNPQILRVALAGVMFWSPVVALGAYAAIAVTVLVSRKLFPNPAAASTATAPQQLAVAAEANNDAPAVELAAAA